MASAWDMAVRIGFLFVPYMFSPFRHAIKVAFHMLSGREPVSAPSAPLVRPTKQGDAANSLPVPFEAGTQHVFVCESPAMLRDVATAHHQTVSASTAGLSDLFQAYAAKNRTIVITLQHSGGEGVCHRQGDNIEHIQRLSLVLQVDRLEHTPHYPPDKLQQSAAS